MLDQNCPLTGNAFRSDLSPRLNRRALLSGATGAGLAATLGRPGWAAAQADPAIGGTLRIAMAGEPPTLDIHQTTAGIVSFIMWSVYEPLFTYDADFALAPMLAASHEVSDDGLTHTIALRQGVIFHNGEELTATDVIASINRWGNISGVGKGLLAAVSELSAPDDYTVVATLSEPYGSFATALAINYQGCAIYPASVIEAAGDGPLETDFVGTGPYRLAEREIDRYIRLARFDDYASLDTEASGYGGAKHAYLDVIEFVPVPDEAARVTGMQAGDYQYLGDISSDQAEIVSGSPNLVVETLPPSGWDTLVLNWESPLMGQLPIRQAVQAALDHEPIMIAAHGEGYYRLDPSVMLAETAWASTAGSEFYNRNDPALAGSLLADAGYDGTPVRLLSTQEYQYLYNVALVATQQLEAAGFTVDLQLTDWATLVERRADPEQWDIFTTSDPFKPDPTQMASMQVCNFPGWWCSDETTPLMTELRQLTDFDERFPIWEQVQSNFYTEVPMIKIGDFNAITVLASEVGGFIPMTQITTPFWNMWLNA